MVHPRGTATADEESRNPPAPPPALPGLATCLASPPGPSSVLALSHYEYDADSKKVEILINIFQFKSSIFQIKERFLVGKFVSFVF